MDATPRTARLPRSTRRALALAAVVAASAGLFAGAGPAQAGVATAVPMAAQAAVTGDGTSAGRAYDLVNAARAEVGLAPLTIGADSTQVATDWAFHMAAGGQLAHNPEMSRQLSGWALVAENVGVGADADQLQGAFMASPGHRANILRENVTEIGVGAVRSGDGRLWIVQVFKLPAGATAPARWSTAPAPAPAVQPFSAPVPAPAPYAEPAPFSPAPAIDRNTRDTV